MAASPPERLVDGPPSVMLTERAPTVPVVKAKIAPPALPAHAIDRPRLAATLGDEHPVVAIVAPPGYGKTMIASAWAAEQPTDAVAWLSVDLLDGQALPFWSHLLDTMSATTGVVDDEPRHLLDERGPTDPLFLATLCTQLHATERPVTLVVDDVDRIVEQQVLDGLAFLVERARGVLRLMATGRTDPSLPFGRWRAAGMLAELRETDLRFDDEEGRRFIDTYGGTQLDDDDVRELLQRVEGWPAGLQLAMLIVDGHDSPRDAVRTVTGSNRLLADYLVAEVLDRLQPEERDVALALSVLDWFDLDLCDDVVGRAAIPFVRTLHHRRLFLMPLDDRPGAYRFHALFRELLETELRWREPERWSDLHRRAAAAFTQRDDRNSAYRHLLAIGDVDAACDLVLAPILDAVDRSGHTELPRLLDALPARVEVTGPDRKLDLAAAWFNGGNVDGARSLTAEVAAAIDPEDAPRQLRVATMHMVIALAMGYIDDAVRELRHAESWMTRTSERSRLEERFGVLGARVAIPLGMPEADRYVAHSRGLTQVEHVHLVAAPAHQSWLHLERGELRGALTCAQEALEAVDRLRNRPNYGTFDALMSAAGAALGAGDLAQALHHVDGARTDAAALGVPWAHIRSGALAAEVNRLLRGGPEALALVLDLRAQFDGVDLGPYLRGLMDRAHIAALVASGRAAECAPLVDELADDHRRRILEARIALHEDDPGKVADLLCDSDTWPPHAHIEALVLSALAGTGHRAVEHMTTALHLGGESGWVSPFLGYGRRVWRLLQELPVDEVHPALHRVMSTTDGSPAGPENIYLEPLTERELTLLTLLPTHLSYAQMGDQLHLSVNTVKTNLKSIYRKLQADSRAAAVDAGKRAGLI